MKSTEQNEQADELVARSQLPTTLHKQMASMLEDFEQASDQNMYVVETSDVSNAYEIAMRADTNVYEIEHPKLHADSNLSTAQSIETKQ